MQRLSCTKVELFSLAKKPEQTATYGGAGFKYHRLALWILMILGYLGQLKQTRMPLAARENGIYFAFGRVCRLV